jgi:predicted aldo/keto reductase-like oxidoreductase
MTRTVELGHATPPVCRLGLATRGNTSLEPTDVRHAIDAGVNYLNWCTYEDGMSRAVGELSPDLRERVFVAAQFYARDADEAQREFDGYLHTLGTEYLDAVTFYYTERKSEWETALGTGGAMEVLLRAREAGKLRMIGVTSHQRPLAAQIAAGGRCDLLMIRYNAAHRGAETEIFPVTEAFKVPVVAYTCLRWGALLETTPDDPPGFSMPHAREWYRFALANPAVAVALMAPNGRAELDADLQLLDDWRVPTPEEMQILRDHGDRAHQHAGGFP